MEAHRGIQESSAWAVWGTTLKSCGVCGRQTGREGKSQFLLPGCVPLVGYVGASGGSQRHRESGVACWDSGLRGPVGWIGTCSVRKSAPGRASPSSCCGGLCPWFDCVHPAVAQRHPGGSAGQRIQGVRALGWGDRGVQSQQLGSGKSHLLLREPCALGGGYLRVCRSVGDAAGLAVWLHGRRQCPRMSSALPFMLAWALCLSPYPELP